MRIPSRHMPAAKSPSELAPGVATAFQGAVVGLLVGLLALVAWASWVAAAGLITLVGILGLVGARSLRRTAADREADSICSFARAFHRREVDPWIVRAVYERYSVLFPVRADDVLDPVEVDYDAIEIAERVGRSLERAEDNPLFEHVSTAGDLVRFLSHQPRLDGHVSRGSLTQRSS